ncbi:BamA/TamA family outer membrane protein [Longibacter sp.]|uniref:BamA/TamA family outer membrane protein n=1 Tax=Longibacter sp. TaxID=2045415 RepID=UPI003EB7D940
MSTYLAIRRSDRRHVARWRVAACTAFQPAAAWAISALLSLLLCAPAHAQTEEGPLRGPIQDQALAAIGTRAGGMDLADTTAGALIREAELPDLPLEAAQSAIYVDGGDSTRTARWRALRQKKALTMEPPDATLAERFVAFVERNRSLVLPDRLVLDIPNADLYGVQPVLGGLSGEAGASGGLYYDLPFFSGPNRHAHAQVLGSLRRYWGTELIGGIEHKRWVGYGFSRYTHRASESFYGIGPNTEVDNRSFYRLDEGMVGGLAGYALNDRLLVGGHLSYRRDRVGPGLHSDEPSVGNAFSPSPPGVRADADYAIGGVFAELDARNDSYNRTYGRRFAPTEERLRGISLDATSGYYLAASLTHHQDIVDRRHSYARLTLDAQQYVTLEHGMQRGLAFRQFLSLSESPDKQTIPFYRMQSIGGPASLRGFTGGRFRDRNVVLTTAEMRCHIWHRLDMALFADAGQVFSEINDVSVEDMKFGYGVGFRFRSSQGVVARFEIARSVEGFSTYLKFGSIL